ncbi:MAG TPA: 4-alpha-glucanotransferase, partial [Pedobacter sp.]|nr:4-alpha-glucanotransferase [Pedobacter sp.]
LYQLIKEIQQGKSWDLWPADLKMRDALSLKKIAVQHHLKLEELKWQQFVFEKQWQKLLRYANSKGICIIGDIPFYVAYDSVDVWTNPSLFKLANDLKINFNAGVPPDYFNASGQLWCMPTYNWKAHKAQKYSWWINRLRKNLTFFNLVRLDHFRAFESYWEVETRHKTAVNGAWKPGPGYDILRKFKHEFPDMPFIAEDLGSIAQAVLALRDAFNLTGMKVLQFAFEDDMVISPHAIHQYTSQQFIVYTGTHDNNTAKGWYKSLTTLQKRRLNDYTGKKVNLTNVHLVLMQLAFSATAKICIVPMQDLLGLAETARLNTPASTINNWIWRLNENKMSAKISSWLKWNTEMYGRD